MLNLVPLAGPGREMADRDGKVQLVGQLLQFPLPQSQACPVAAARVRGDQQAAGLGVGATAFGTPVAPLDVNVRRVMSRVSGSDPGSRDLQETADALVDPRHPRRWLNAVMDLAASTCTKAAPRCGSCPLSRMCASRGDISVAAMPRRSLPFPQTTRWLRGRLVASLTSASPGAWIPLPPRIGDHDAAAIMAAARSLEREGFLELLDGCARVRP